MNKISASFAMGVSDKSLSAGDYINGGVETTAITHALVCKCGSIKLDGGGFVGETTLDEIGTEIGALQKGVLIGQTPTVGLGACDGSGSPNRAEQTGCKQKQDGRFLVVANNGQRLKVLPILGMNGRYRGLIRVTIIAGAFIRWWMQGFHRPIVAVGGVGFYKQLVEIAGVGSHLEFKIKQIW